MGYLAAAVEVALNRVNVIATAGAKFHHVRGTKFNRMSQRGHPHLGLPLASVFL